MLKVAVIRKSDGERVLIEFEDRGDVVPGLTGDGRRFEAWTTRVSINGEDTFIQVEKAKCPDGADPMQFRMTEDIAHLDALGYEYVGVER